MGFFSRLREHEGGAQPIESPEVARLRLWLSPEHAAAWASHGGRRYMLSVVNYEVSDVFVGMLELGQEVAGRRPRVQSGRGAVAVCPLALVWVSTDMGKAAEFGGGGRNGRVIGHQITEVSKFGSNVVGVAWRDDYHLRAQLAIRTDDQQAVYLALTDWTYGISRASKRSCEN